VIEQAFVYDVAMPWQGSLFDTGTAPAVDEGLLGLRRIVLDGESWLDHHPGWICPHDLVFDHLRSAVAWRSDRRPMYDRTVEVPRLVASFDPGEEIPHPVLGRAREVLERHYRDPSGPRPRFAVSTCLYRDGRDSVAWHGDRIGRSGSGHTVVAVVSLGQPRRFLLRPASGGRSLRFDLGEGDLLVMGGRCQVTWRHCVPKTARPVGPRISVQFRSSCPPLGRGPGDRVPAVRPDVSGSTGGTGRTHR
jgi:alkylated DNA repair dioxygenase AlkB